MSDYNLERELRKFTPSIWLNTMPKSGSVYLWYALTKGLTWAGYKKMRLANLALLDSRMLGVDTLAQFNQGKAVAQDHAPASLYNILTICCYLDKMVLHIRDPRNSLVSWIHFINKNNEDKIQQRSVDHSPFQGEHWRELDASQKFNICYNYYYLDLIKWLSDWFNALDINFSSSLRFDSSNVFICDGKRMAYGMGRYKYLLPGKTKVLLTTHENLVNMGEDALLESILYFYSIPRPLYKKIEMNKDESTHFRSGRTDGWLRELTPEQQDIVTADIPPEWGRFFRWHGFH
jgi:hypothetical protein